MLGEKTFEAAIIAALVERGYEQGDPKKEYLPSVALSKSEFFSFIRATQPKQWAKLESIHGAEAEDRLFLRLHNELELRGCLDVLRKGIVDYGVRFQLAYFAPASSLNPDLQRLYALNRLRVYQQVYYSTSNKNSVDIVLALNGIPVATMELKNQFTGQNVRHALKQYSQTRDSREPLFAFKKRALVHFAIDQDEVYMTTKLDDEHTHWLPFNKGCDNGKGNPINPNGYKTAYLWEEILSKDSWLEIIQQFIHLQSTEIEANGRKYKRENLIFPRYHQLDAVRKLAADALRVGVGTNYLIQHSAGSGKSNTIAWLSYRLSSLHDKDNEKLFNAVIVVTDRRVLDQQLQETIYQFEHKSGVVQRIDKDSTQLAAALGSSTPIIITTLQKFPYVLDKVADLPERKYAVIIDEAHSSQGGNAHQKMKEVLAAKSLEAAALEEAEDDENGEDFVREQVSRSALARGKQKNISFFAFTATPKYKTLDVFGHKDADNKPKAFHLYAMRQAIEEGFILDVLQNYTSYELYYKLTKAISDDPQLNKKKATKAIGKYVSLHPHNLAQKTDIIVEHFRSIVAKKIGGRAKAMLVCGSRLHAKRYFEEFERTIKAKGYQNELKILVAFSGRVIDADDARHPDGVTEPNLTGVKESELPALFEEQEYKLLIVADKYQTGFDQPLLHTMYVDKRLSGVKAVQTLSRLNRTCAGKEDTFVLDFVNDRKDILASFQPYYELATITEEPDINHLFDLRERLNQFRIYEQQDIIGFANIYFDPQAKMHHDRVQKMLYSFTDKAVQAYNAIAEEDKREEFKKGLRTWTNLYSFLAQIMPFVDVDSEKFFAYAKLLQTRLPRRDASDILHLDNEVALEYYRLQKIQEGNISLVRGENGELSGVGEAGLKKAKEDEALLSEIINVLNEHFGTEFEAADKLFFDQIELALLADEQLKTQAKANKIDAFKYVFDDKFVEMLVERMEQNQEIFHKILENHSFGDVVKKMMLESIYKKFNAEE